MPVKRRKCRYVKIQDVKRYSLQLQTFIETYIDTLVLIRLENCSFKMSDLHSALTMVGPKLEQIVFRRSRITDQKEFPKIEMPKLQYLKFTETLEGNDVRVFISMANTCNLENLVYDLVGVRGNVLPFKDALVLIEFITLQKNLTQLSLLSTFVVAALKYWFETPLEAKLKSLEIVIRCKCVNINFLHLKALVGSQSNTLKELLVSHATLEEDKFQDILNLGLKSLQLGNCSLEWNSDRMAYNNTIKYFAFANGYEEPTEATLDALVRFLTSCEALVEVLISFNRFEERFQPLLEAVARKNTITSLAVREPCCLNAMTFPSVKTMWFLNNPDWSDYKKIKKLLFANPQVTNVNFQHKPKEAHFEKRIKRMARALNFEYEFKF